MDYPNDSESYYLHLLDNLRHQDVPALQFANLVFRFCDGKFPFTEEHLSKLATLATEKLISESPLKEILLIFDTDEFREQLIKHQFTYDRFFVFCRYLCRSDKQGFDILAYAFFVKPWEKNPYFQLGFIKYCIDTCNVEEILSKCSPERYPIVPQIELLKSQPDFEKDKSLTSWKYVCSYRIVASLSENISFQSFCEDMLFQPLNKCPDLLVLGLFEVIDPLQQQQPPKQIPKLVELFLRKAVNRFIDPTQPNPSQPNATQIFQRLWPSDFSQAATPATLNWSQRLLIQVMLECYSNAPLGENQATKLKQILDLSQDLKALNVLLSTNSYVFVIDLACLVSRREYLKLDKWLNDKIAKNGQPFVDASIHFLRTRCTFFGARDFSNNGYPIEIFRLILESLKQSINFDEPKTPRELEIVKMYKAFIHLQMPGGNGSGSLKGSQFETAYNQQIMQTGQGQGGSRAVTTSAPLPPPVSMDNFHSFVPDALA